MFQVNDDLSIYVTRGDMVFLRITADKDGEPYTFQPGELVRFKVFAKKDCEDVVLEKDFPVTAVTQGVDIILTGDDTKIGDVISKPRDLWYEVELNPLDNPMTIIGYDEDGAKVFKLFPEGADIPQSSPDPRIMRAIDTELDMTSERPVQNQVIARAFANLQGGFQAVHDAVAAMHVTPQMFGAIGDGKADDTAALQMALDTSFAVVFPEGTYVISEALTVKKPNQIVRGVSNNAVIKAANGMVGDMLVLDGSVSPAYRSNQQISNLHLKGNGVCNGIRFRKNADFYIDTLKVSDCEWGVVSSDSLLYNVFASTIIDCANGILFENSSELSAANNVSFEMCKIIQIAKYAIYSEDENSTHNVVFQCCEIEATNTSKTEISPITLLSKSGSGASPVMTFRNCWFEQNNGVIPVLIAGTDGYQKQYVFDGCTIMNAANACDYFISASGRTLVMLNQSDPCTYKNASLNMSNGRLLIIGGIFSYNVDDENTVTHLGYDGFVNSNLVFRSGYGTHYKSAGGTDHNRIYAQSNKLKIKSDVNVIELDGAMGVDMTNSYLKPMVLGTIYLWAHKEKIYCKYNSRPTAYNDGTVLITLT